MALAFSPLAAAAAADDPAPAVVSDPYEDIYVALLAGVNTDVAIAGLVNSIIASLQSEIPELAIIEDSKPGTIAGLHANILPVMADYSSRVSIAYRPRMIATLREVLTPEEAQSTAAFYQSDLGKKLLAGVSENYTMENTIRSATKAPDAPIETGALEADIKRTGIQAYLSLSSEDREKLNRLAIEQPALAKIGNDPKIRTLRLEMENTELSPEENLRLEQAIKSAFSALADPDQIN